MGSTLETVVFYFLAVFISVTAILTVTTSRIVRSATYLLFVLFGTAGIYFLLGYTFLGSVQMLVYAGGIVVLYVFSTCQENGEIIVPSQALPSPFPLTHVVIMLNA